MKNTISVALCAIAIISSGISLATARKLAYPDLPNRTLTPGVGHLFYTVRNVPQSEKDQVYREYGLDPRHHRSCEVDHLVSLELGGSNDIANLWPEHYSEPWGAHDKDRLEDHLASLVRHGTITLTEAQRAISTDWIVAYKRYMAISPREQ